MGAVLWAKMLLCSNIGRRFAASKVALSERSRPWHGARREAAPRKLGRASVEGCWPPSGASRPWAGGQRTDLNRVAPT
eukprot:5197233-Alexandrium_andersonii.AAC.1